MSKLQSQAWYALSNVDEVASPALLLYVERVEENIRRMLALAGGPARLRPHIKTHKLAEVLRMQSAAGITKFKCATIAEAEMAAAAGAPDVLLAYPVVGPNIGRLVELVRRFPATRFATVADDRRTLDVLSVTSSANTLRLPVLLDLDCGMHRTGIAPGPQAAELYAHLSRLPGLELGGLHAYDGHIHDKDPEERARRCAQAFAPVNQLRDELLQAGLAVPAVVAGGTPTFPVHARNAGVECSPGTCVFWDAGYSGKMPDLDFLCAALVLTRVVSKPGTNRLCLDLGHKAIASENPHPRVRLMEVPDSQAVMHSEEHLVIETARAADFAVGDVLYGIPWHICPTVALHAEAIVVQHGRAEARWKISARDRVLTV